MKKYLLFFVAAALAALLAGCGSSAGVPAQPSQPDAPTDMTEQTVSLLCSDGSVTLRFRQDENGLWQWMDDPSFPLDTQYVDELLSVANALEALTPISDPDEPGEYGLSSPEAYLMLAHSDGTERTWYFGDSADGGRYACPADDTSRVCVAPDEIWLLIGRSIYDMARLPKLPQLTAERLCAVTVIRGEERDEFTVSDGVWMQNGSDATETERVTRLVELLGSLRVSKCFDYAPSEGVAEVCGLVSPAAVLEVTYVNTVGVDSTYTLRVGGLQAEGSARCVTLDDDPTIYLMDSAALTVLTDRGAEEG